MVDDKNDDAEEAALAKFVQDFERQFLQERKEELDRWGRGIQFALYEKVVAKMIDANEYRDLLWIDVEASSLSADSYPIEIGWCGVDLQPTSFLIRPLPQWTTEAWSPASEKVHGISRQHLVEFGHDPADVASWLNAVTNGKIVLSDNPAYDEKWLDRLYDDIGVAREFELLDSATAAGAAAGISRLSQPEAESLLTRIHQRFPHPHRAGPDCRRCAAEFLVLAMPHELDAIEAMA